MKENVRTLFAQTVIRNSAALERRLAAEIVSLRAEAEALPPGELRGEIEEKAEYAEKLVDSVRRMIRLFEANSSL